MNQPSNDEYVYKYSGGLGTYCAKHRPFAIYSAESQKTFFCYGGVRQNDSRHLVHMVSCFDHVTGTVPQPTILLDKKTNDAHDNPVIALDQRGHIWIFSTSHGRARPSFVHRSVRPFDVAEFRQVNPTFELDGKRAPLDNFSYMQIWDNPNAGPTGFSAFFTRYGDPAKRTIGFMSTRDGVHWDRWQRLAAIEEGHYQISGRGKTKIGTMFNFHPKEKGLNWRTNLYYLESRDDGRSWQTVDGALISPPIINAENPALIRNYQSEGLNVYLKDIQYDDSDHPILLYLTSKGYQSGPQNNPRTWTIARWTGFKWEYSETTTSDNNYDFGELWIENETCWHLIAPTEPGPQLFNPGGEIAHWYSFDQGKNWIKQKRMTRNSSRNHTYVRRVLNAHPDFVAFWADGHGRKPSESRLYYANASGIVFELPTSLNKPTKPLPLKAPN